MNDKISMSMYIINPVEWAINPSSNSLFLTDSDIVPEDWVFVSEIEVPIGEASEKCKIIAHINIEEQYTENERKYLSKKERLNDQKRSILMIEHEGESA